jgi:hypothetical protein
MKIFYSVQYDKLILAEFLEEEITHWLLTIDGDMWISSLLMDTEDFVYIGNL